MIKINMIHDVVYFLFLIDFAFTCSQMVSIDTWKYYQDILSVLSNYLTQVMQKKTFITHIGEKKWLILFIFVNRWREIETWSKTTSRSDRYIAYIYHLLGEVGSFNDILQ